MRVKKNAVHTSHKRQYDRKWNNDSDQYCKYSFHINLLLYFSFSISHSLILCQQKVINPSDYTAFLVIFSKNIAYLRYFKNAYIMYYSFFLQNSSDFQKNWNNFKKALFLIYTPNINIFFGGKTVHEFCKKIFQKIPLYILIRKKWRKGFKKTKNSWQIYIIKV